MLQAAAAHLHVRAACGGAHAGVFKRVAKFQDRESRSLKDGSAKDGARSFLNRSWEPGAHPLI